MPIPFLKKHSEEQYIDLEKNYLNLYNFLQSLLTITEGEDLDSDSQKITHFNALCMRINQGIEEYANFTDRVKALMFKRYSATTSSKPDPVGDIKIICNKKEYELILEAIEHIAHSFPDLKVADEFHDLARDLKNLKQRR
jgi:hypothetical protein